MPNQELTVFCDCLSLRTFDRVRQTLLESGNSRKSADQKRGDMHTKRSDNMFKNYLKTACRNILRSKIYSFINIAGLAVGMAACITIFVYVEHESSFDSFNKRAGRIYRINVQANLDGKTTQFALTPALLGPFLRSQSPQVEHVVRLYAPDVLSAVGSPVLKYHEKVLRARHFILVDPSFFDVFSFRMIRGNPKTALDAPFSVVLTEDAAERLFGDQDPIGRTIVYNDKFHFTVTGTVENPPSNSTIQFDYLGSMNSLPAITNQSDVLSNRREFNYYTYLLLSKKTNVAEIEPRLEDDISRFWGPSVHEVINTPKICLEALRDIYWDGSAMDDIPIKGSKNTIMAFSVIAGIILLIGCVNFINLSTARSLSRNKEIAIRKVVGSQRGQVIGQFMTESGLICLLALMASVVLSELFLPVLNRVLGTKLQADYLHNLAIIIATIGIWSITSLLSGVVPAFYLSSLKPASTLRWSIGGARAKRSGRQFFILFQFSSAIVLIFSTIVVTKEYHLLRSRNLGFDKNNIVILRGVEGVDGSYEPFKQALLENAHVLGVTATDIIPGRTLSYGPLFYSGGNGVERLQAYWGDVDTGYIPVFGLKLLAGRDFSVDIPSDRSNAYILNYAAVKKIGWTPTEAIGKQVDVSGGQLNGRVVGVIKDYNFLSLRSKVEPLFLIMRDHSWRGLSLAVKISPKDFPGTLGFIERTWKKMYPDNPFEYNFLDKSLDALYKSEKRSSVLFNWFSILSIAITCFGLYGLALYTAERRAKEVGIRRVLGASATEITFILSKEFAMWVVIANVIAWPVGYYIMNNWLEEFAYRINITPWIFLISGVLALVVAALTVGFHAIRAAIANPVESLRYE